MSFTLKERQSLATIASLYLIRMLGLFMVLPVLSLYGAELGGSSPFLIGLALGIYGLAQALLQIPFGWASDRIGRKKVLIVGFGLFVVGSLICSYSDHIGLLIVGRAIQGAGAVSAVLLAVLSDWIEEDNRTTAMAVVGVSIGLSFGISIIAAPVIVSHYGGLSAVFNLSAGSGLLALFLVLYFVPTSDSPSNQTNLSKLSGSTAKSPGQNINLLMESIWIANLVRLNFGIFALHFMQMCIWVAVPIVLLENLGIAIDDHWVIYLIAVAGGFILMAPFMRFWDKRGKTKLAIVMAISCIIVSLLLMSRIGSYGNFVFGLFLFFWGFNLLEATLPSTVTKIARPEAKGRATGVYSTCQFLGVFAGGTIGGLMLSQFGVVSVFYLSAAIALIWLLIMLPAKGFSRRQT